MVGVVEHAYWTSILGGNLSSRHEPLY
jgi:hypothetical protein